MSHYTFKGRLCGYICAECPEPLANLQVRLYRVDRQRNVAALAVANPKETFAILDDDQVQGKESRLLAKAETDAEGNFTFDLTENYAGEAFEVDVYCGSVPRQKIGRTPPKPRQFTITTLQPRYRETENGFIAVWDYCLPYRFWCAVLALFDVWTICGRLRTCASPQTPIAGATVKAFDADWLQDDPLGSALTDAAGKFIITYSSGTFRQGTWIDVELIGGPDVYFTAKLGGVNILNETQADGRSAGRENVGHCFCVELCSDEVQPPDVEHIPHWQQVEVFDIHPFPSATGFSAEGYAGGPANSYVFGGGVTLKGNCPLRNIASPANALEYRFLIGEWTWPGGVDDSTALPTVAPAAMAPVTQIATTHVGDVFYTDGLGLPASAQVHITASDLLPGGWIRVDNKAVTVDMHDGTTSVVSVNSSNFLRTFDLFVLNSPAITSAHPAKLPGGLPILDAGRSLTTAEREPIRRYRLTFEVRDGVTVAPVATDTLDSIVLNNSPVALALDLEELRTNACNPVSAGAVHILYTIDHPHLRFFSLGISNNNGGVHPPPPLPNGNFAPPPPTSNYFFRGGAGGPHQPANNGGFAVDVSTDPSCAYRVALSWQTRHYLSTATSTDRLYCK
jgi:hypothetical protein